MTPTGVIQVKQGIGDVMWHLPFIKAIAAASPGGRVTFFTLPSSRGRELLQAEPCIARTIYFEHQGNELMRGVHLARLVALLRRERLRTIWILDRTTRPALAAWLAGIPQRIGVGFGPQRLFLSNRGIDRRHFHEFPSGWFTALLNEMQVPLHSAEPDLHLPAAATAAIGTRYGALARPWTVLALGGSHPSKEWPAAHWKEFFAGLRQRTAGTIFVIGGPDYVRAADALIATAPGAAAVNACGLDIIEATALMQQADLFVGPDSGPLNLAAAVGTNAFGLFGSTPVHATSRFIHPIQPPDGVPAPDGMGRILPADVLARIASYLNAAKPRQPPV